jgi:hypothetical protein
VTVTGVVARASTRVQSASYVGFLPSMASHSRLAWLLRMQLLRTLPPSTVSPLRTLWTVSLRLRGSLSLPHTGRRLQKTVTAHTSCNGCVNVIGLTAHSFIGVSPPPYPSPLPRYNFRHVTAAASLLLLRSFLWFPQLVVARLDRRCSRLSAPSPLLPPARTWPLQRISVGRLLLMLRSASPVGSVFSLQGGARLLSAD